MTAPTKPCKHCIAYIADWYDQELCGSFDKWTVAHLSRGYLPKATAEITRMLMKYVEEYDRYVKIRDAIRNHIELSGVSHTIHLFSTTVPIVAETIEVLEHLMAETSAKDFALKQFWIREKLLELFMDLIDVHGVHLGKAPFIDVWQQRYVKKMELARAMMKELETKEGGEGLVVVNELDELDDF